jgi:uncharacterized repeat protein (TIGR03843 family)
VTERLASSRAPVQALSLLSEGTIAVEGLIPWSSNAILLVTVRRAGVSCLAVYKPQRGETPLWDFGQGTLGKREVAAYLVCTASGWGFVPPTVLREGPFGLGSLQLFVHAREDAHYFTVRDGGSHVADLMRLAVFDAVANNADRKAGHCLLDKEDRLWAIDNALTFHADPKIRTVIWDFAGQPLPADILTDLVGLQAAIQEGTALSQALSPLLAHEELTALRLRLQRLIASRRFPEPGPGRAVPWPIV